MKLLELHILQSFPVFPTRGGLVRVVVLGMHQALFFPSRRLRLQFLMRFLFCGA